MTKARMSRLRPLHMGHYAMPATDTRYPSDRIIVTAYLIDQRLAPGA